MIHSFLINIKYTCHSSFPIHCICMILQISILLSECSGSHPPLWMLGGSCPAHPLIIGLWSLRIDVWARPRDGSQQKRQFVISYAEYIARLEIEFCRGSVFLNFFFEKWWKTVAQWSWRCMAFTTYFYILGGTWITDFQASWGTCFRYFVLFVGPRGFASKPLCFRLGSRMKPFSTKGSENISV